MPPFAPTETRISWSPLHHTGATPVLRPLASPHLSAKSSRWCFAFPLCTAPSVWPHTGAEPPRGGGKDMKCNSACFSFLALADHLHPCTLSHTPGSVVLWLWGTQPFSAVLCGWLKVMANTKNLSKGSFSPEFMSYLSLAAMTYKQAADVVPDGGKILRHIERLFLPKIHSLLSRIQPFNQFFWVSVVATGGNKTQTLI